MFLNINKHILYSKLTLNRDNNATITLIHGEGISIDENTVENLHVALVKNGIKITLQPIFFISFRKKIKI